MNEKIKRNWFGQLAAAVLIFAALLCLYRMLQPGEEMSFGPEQLLFAENEGLYFEAGVLEDNAPGWYVDNGMEYGEIFASTPEMDLGVGTWDITIAYQAGGEDSNYSFASEVNTYRVLLGRQKEKLETGRKSKTLTVNFTEPIEGFVVQTGYGGAGYLIVNGISIKQTRDMEHMVLTAVCFLFMCWAAWTRIKKRENMRQMVLVGAGTALVASLALMMPYLNRADDLYFHLLRIEGIAEGLKAGQFPVRVQPGWMNGYGYPVSIFYGDGILYVAGLLRYIGFPLQLAYKIYITFLNFLTFIVAAWSFKRIVGNQRIAMLGGVVYTLAPYRLMNIYLRAAVGEYTALTFLPLILVGTWEILLEEDEDKRKFSWLILAAGMTGIIQSHILTCEIVGILLVVVCLICWRRLFTRRVFGDFLKAAGASVLINLSFLVPFLDYMRDDFYVNSGDFGGRIQTNGVFMNQLFAFFPHGYGFERSVVDGLYSEAEKPMAIGVVFVLGIILFFLLQKRQGDIQEKQFRLGRFCCMTGIVLLAMSTVWFPWDFLHDSSFIGEVLISRLQFPWRLLGAAGLLLTVVLCVALSSLKNIWGKSAAAGAAFAVITAMVLPTGYFFTSMMEESNYLYIADVGSFSSFELVSGEYVPAGVDWKREKMPEGRLWHSEAVSVAESKQNGTNYSVTCANISETPEALELPMLYYRGYRAADTATGKQLSVGAGENGRLSVSLPGNYMGTLRVRFTEPVLWRLTELVSLLSVAAFLYFVIRKKGIVSSKIHGDKV